MLHFRIGHREEVDSRLLVGGSQTGSLTPGPSFAHNLGYRCPNGSCEAILDIYSSRPSQWHNERTKTRIVNPSNRLLSFRESRRTPSLPLCPKWGCDTLSSTQVLGGYHNFMILAGSNFHKVWYLSDMVFPKKI